MKCEIRISHESYLGPLPSAGFGAGLLDYLSSTFIWFRNITYVSYNGLRGGPVFVCSENGAGTENFLDLGNIILCHKGQVFYDFRSLSG